MYRLVLLVLVVLFFGACSSPSSTAFFGKDELFANSIQYTKKADLISSFETKAILHATYLNCVDSRFDNDQQNFIIGVYISEDENDKSKRFLKNPNFTLSMNSMSPSSVVELNSTHMMYGHIPLFNNWAKYYEVKFDDVDSTALELKLSHHSFGSTTISFEKE